MPLGPYLIAIVVGVVISGVIYMVVFWPTVEPDADDEDFDDGSSQAP